jgi:cytochrome c biogenesis protein CcmG/thiol:disulfide interchange protein DsbE
VRPHRTRTVAAALSVVLTLAACGGDDAADAPADSVADDTADIPADEPADDTDEPAPESTDEPADDTDEPAPESTDEPAGDTDGPVSTLSPEIPEEYAEGIAPVDVIGDPLPRGIDAADDPAIGMPAPTLVGFDLDGEPIVIDPSTDGPMMLVFLAHWCSHCNAEVPRLNQLRDDGRFPDGLSIYAVATGSRPDQPNWPPTDWLQDTMDWTYPALLDGVDLEAGSYIAYDAYGVEGFPSIVLVDEDGDVAFRWSGEREPDNVIALLDEHLGLN